MATGAEIINSLKRKVEKECVICGKKFETSARNRKYCEECRAVVCRPQYQKVSQNVSKGIKTVNSRSNNEK